MPYYQNVVNKTVLPYLVFALVFSLFLGSAVFSILIAVIVLLWTLSGEWALKLEAIKNNAVVNAAVLFFLVISLGLLWADVPWPEKLAMYFKYHKLLYIPVIASIIQTQTQRRQALNSFLIVSIIILFISYGKWLGLIPFHDQFQGYIVTRGRIAHNIFMAFAAFLMLHQAARHRATYRWIWVALSFLAIVNVLFLINGRTGQLILVGLITLFAWQVAGMKSIKYVVLAVLLGLLAFQYLPVLKQSRMAAVSQEAKDPAGSAGLRLGFYKQSLNMIKAHPIIGVGTGGFQSAYLAEAKVENNPYPTTNPHNQFLLTTVELGLIGLAAFLGLLWATLVRANVLMVASCSFFIKGLLLTFVLGSMFNSLLLDAGEGRFFTTLLAVLVG